jgi:hypothetical protein
MQSPDYHEERDASVYDTSNRSVLAYRAFLPRFESNYLPEAERLKVRCSPFVLSHLCTCSSFTYPLPPQLCVRPDGGGAINERASLLPSSQQQLEVVAHAMLPPAAQTLINNQAAQIERLMAMVEDNAVTDEELTARAGAGGRGVRSSTNLAQVEGGQPASSKRARTT